MAGLILEFSRDSEESENSSLGIVLGSYTSDLRKVILSIKYGTNYIDWPVILPVLNLLLSLLNKICLICSQ